MTSPPLANPGDPIRVVDDVMRMVGEFLPATVTTPDWTLIYSIPHEPAELYDMRADPQQEHDLAREFPEVVAELRDGYLDLLRSVGTSDGYLAPRRP